jgi:hypothetical protein
MADDIKIFISHTTQDIRDHSLAYRLAKGLKVRGAKVWIAPDNIPAGSKWEEKIVTGIMNECTHFLVILSVASTMAEWVLKEIKLAEERFEHDSAFKILPLVVGKLGKYAGREFMDQFQRVPYHEEFSAQLNAIASELGLPPSIPDQFRTFIESRTEGFVGRKYVFNAFDEFTNKEDKGYFIVQGDPGEGKSAILAEYVKRTGCITHFNIRSEGITRPSQFLDNICSQLVARFGLSEGVASPEKEDDGGRLRRVLEEASSQLCEDDRLIIAVDALDEVDQTGQTAGSNILYLPQVLPKGVFLIMTRRRVAPPDMPFFIHCPQHIFDLEDYKDECTEDIEIYIRRASKRPKLRTWISSRKLDRDEFVKVLSGKSDRNFMYLYYVLPEIDHGAYRDLDIQKLPLGLKGYYEDHWDRMGMRAKPLLRDKINIVYILCEVRQPVSCSLILDFAREKNVRLEEPDIQEILDEWRQFLHIQPVDKEPMYSVYHTSFRDFLHRKDIVRAAGVTIKGINKMIADNLWRDLFPDENSEKKRRHASRKATQRTAKFSKRFRNRKRS